jgi:O-antigen/teichoic acid export membrane protein
MPLLGVPRLRSVLTGAHMHYVVVRYVASVLVAAEALFLARALGPSAYGDYAIIAQIAVLLIFVTIGSNAGYVYAHFREVHCDLDAYYVAGAVGQFIAGALLVALCVSFLRPYFLLGVVLFLIQIPYLLTEPMLRVRSYFAVTALGRGLPALITLLIAGLYFAFQAQGSGLRLPLGTALAIMLIGNVAGYGIYYYVLVRKRYIVLHPLKTFRALRDGETWRQYWKLVLVPGIPLNASSIIIVIFQNVDRLFIDQYRAAAALSVYSLAWQLSQGVLLMLTSMNLISGVRVGERMRATGSAMKAELTRQFLLTAAAGGVSFFALLIGTWVLNLTVYRDYDDLVLITFLLSIGYLAMNVIGSITGLMFYQGRAKQMTIGYLAVFAASVLGNVAAVRFNTWYGVPIAFSSLALIVLNVWFAFYTYGIARRLSHAPPAGQPA